jgi:hypothetical protein
LSNNGKSDSNINPVNTRTGVIAFQVTESMKKIGIKDFILNRSDFEITFSDNKKISVLFSSNDNSVSKQQKRIELKLRKASYAKFDNTDVDDAIADVEDQLIRRRDEIFKVQINGLDENYTNTEDPSKSKFKEDVTNLRNQFKQAGTTYQQWQSIVAEKYENLRKVTVKHYPEAWPFLEFCLAGKSILNIEGITLPFMGVILAAPASMKTLIIQLFRKYPGSFYSDNFTANSLVSHNSALTEERLQQVDMLPKLKDKLVLTPELAPIFTSKEDDLQKILGIITRILDGHGFESDSGAQGHRQYRDTMFVWIGAAVEIPFRVWKVLGSLGHKIYFLRPQLSEKTTKQLKQIAKTNDFGTKFKEIEDALLDYLKYFDAAPESLPQTQSDKNGIIKIRWNHELEGEQDKATGYIAEVAREAYENMEKGIVAPELLEIKTTLKKDAESYPQNRYQRIVGNQVNAKEGGIIKYYKSDTKGKAHSDPDLLSRTKYLQMLKSTFEDQLKVLGYDFTHDVVGVRSLAEFI